MIRSEARRLGARFRPRFQNQDLMSHQAGLGNNGAEATGLTKPDDGDDRMQKKSENVAHGRNGIKLNKLDNSGHLRNSPTTGPPRSPDSLPFAALTKLGYAPDTHG